MRTKPRGKHAMVAIWFLGTGFMHGLSSLLFLFWDAYKIYALGQMGNQNLTQADLAKASGLTRTAISDYINQKRTNPEPHALIALAKALHVSPLNIFRVAGLLPNDHLSENDRFLNDWREILSGLTKRDQELLKQTAITMRSSKKE